MTKQYTYNKDMFEFYLSDGSCVQGWQVEGGNVWTLEIFPPEQSTESFESCQYSGGLTLFEIPKEASTLGGKPETSDWYFQEYPDNWTDSMHKELIEQIEDEIKNIKLINVKEL